MSTLVPSVPTNASTPLDVARLDWSGVGPSGASSGSSFLRDLVGRPAGTSIADWQIDTASGGDSPFDFAAMDSPSQTGTTRELVIIDRATPNYQALVEDLLTNAAASRRFKLEWIDTGVDGVAAIGDLLARYSNLDAVHVVSHGRPGAVQLGNVVLSSDNLDQYRSVVRGWGDALAADGDILFYGCQLAAGPAGESFVDDLARLTGADVAASDDITGAAALGGDWVFEYTSGVVQSPMAFSAHVQTSWAGELLIAQEYYVPLPSDQLRSTYVALYPSAGTTLDSVIGITVAQPSAILYYDQWEDGYETNIESPTQSTTQVWGDGNPANGIPPGFATDILNASSVITLRNNIATPRNSGTILYDGRDRIVSNKAITVSTSAWATTPGTVLADAGEVVPVNNWGTDYRAPIGQNAPSGAAGAAFGQMFEYVSMFVMASQNGTTIAIDKDGNGTTDITTTLSQGQGYQVNGGIMVGARVTSNNPIQVQLVTGNIGATYEMRWFSLYPFSQWGTSYYAPVGTTVATAPAATFLYNPGTTALTVTVDSLAGSGVSIIVPPANDPSTHGVVRFQMPTNSGAHFTAPSPF
ncbi:MAG TPA: DUF4347 domain-containing protein, partial [Pirellulaceae bacterium]|nr:DUF4347 domain-containing protein [Pirellulaceae bacterium]